MNIIFVGDRPSAKNIDPNIPFVGTKSYKKLLEWIKILEIENYVLLNSHTEIDIFHVKTLYGIGYLVIALGNNASKRLSKAEILHHKLPHPSGLNRKLNDKEYVDSELKKCYAYLRGKPDVQNLSTMGK